MPHKNYSAEYSAEIARLVEEGKIENNILLAKGDKCRGVWSDRFFNFDDVPSVTMDDEESDAWAKCIRAAELFKTQWPTCPFSKEWLAEDFLQRL